MSEDSELDAQTGLPVGLQVDSTVARWPDAKLLSGCTARLETLDVERHGDGLWAAIGGEHQAALWVYMSEGPFIERATFETVIRRLTAKPDSVFFAIVDEKTDRALGWSSFLNIKPEHRAIEVGNLVFSPRLQRTPAATEALYLMARYAFDELGYRRYEWKCNALNAKSRRAAERFGFTFEGIFRQHMIVKGRNRDTAWFSITADEWPAVKQALESWLSAENFDASGQQMRKLSEWRAGGTDW